MSLAELETPAMAANPTCWICGSHKLSLAKSGNLPDDLGADAFRITDKDYGATADIYRCADCGFLECPNLPDVLDFYTDMDDDGYEDTRDQRALQAGRLVRQLAGARPAGRLLDVGAGSGILVAEALRAGYEAQGVEPSVALQKRAVAADLPVKLGVLPDPALAGPFDCVTLVDVIEHVPDPVGLLRDIADVLADDGVCLLVTPDANSLAARLMGWRWWHFRIAHIGYFDRTTLTQAIEAAGLEVQTIGRPTWYFPASYLAERVFAYAPRWLRPPLPKFLDRLTVPLNLFDSYTVICRRKRS